MAESRLRVNLNLLRDAISNRSGEPGQISLKIARTLTLSLAGDSRTQPAAVKFVSDNALLARRSTFPETAADLIQVRTEQLKSKLAEFTSKTAHLAESNASPSQKSVELEQSNAGLKELLGQQGDLISALIVDVKKPLIGCIRVLEQVLGEGELPHSASELLNAVLRTQTTMLRMISNVLDSYKLEYDSLVPSSELVNVPTLLKECLEEARFSIAERHLMILMDVGQENLWIQTDAALLRRALMNIIDNAIKFSPVCGRFGIKLSCFESHLSIAISDSNSGMSQSQLEQIFKGSWQIDSGRNSDVGTDVGLYLSKQIVELLGGSIKCTSSAFVGTEFIVSLPLPEVVVRKIAKCD